MRHLGVAVAALLLSMAMLPARPASAEMPLPRPLLRVGGDAHYPPYHFLDQDGRPDGFDIRLAQAVAGELGREPVFQLGDWSATLQRLERGELDVVPMFWSADRERRYLFSEPILLRHHALFGRPPTPTVESLQLPAGARVAVQHAGLAWEALHALRRDDVHVVEVEKEADALDAVVRGAADYALVPTGIGYHAIQQGGLAGFVALSPPLLERKYVFAVRRDDPALLRDVNGALVRLREDGWQNRLYEQWLGHPGPGGPDAIREPRSGAWLAALAVLGLGFTGMGVLVRRRALAGPGHAALAPPHVPADRPAGHALLDDLRDAIANGRLGFALQPKTDLRSGRVLGAELLVRWNHPRLGPLSPDDFVPLAEQAHAIGDMTLYLVRHGLKQWDLWPRTGDCLHVSINVSANDLADPALVDAIIEAAGDASPRLMLEVTETAVMREPARVAEALPRLRAHGIRISVDDFGAGHSSLVNLRRLAPDELKIDRSFVGAVLESASDRAIVKATIDLGHELGASVAAEGIEDEATLVWLAEAGCDTAQGYWIARPMPPGDFIELLRAQA